MAWLLQILGVILRVLLPALLKRDEPTCEDAQRQPELRRRLQERVRETWGRSAVILVLVLSLVVFAGCGRGTRTVYVPHTEPVRLRETVRNVKVWVKDSTGKTIPGRLDLPEGGFYLTMPEPKTD